HNKFFVLSRNGAPKHVWTGSTNLSVNGIFGHSNNAHIIRDPKVARAFKAYWDRLWGDPTKKPLATKNAEETPAPPPKWLDETEAIFSPQPDVSPLDWYASLAGRPKKPLFATFAFGMNEKFVPIYERRDGVLRFALMEKKGNGKQLKEQSKVIDRVRRLPNTVVAVGDAVDKDNTFDRWLVERVKIVSEAHVLFVHTKYMLIDPLGSEPIVIVGSANFSKASCDTNDENMLVIRGNKTVADIYIGEFMRLHAHYAYRESLGFRRTSEKDYARRRKYLVESTDWIKGESQGQGYFDKGGARALRRVYFSGG
ncbi:MAG: phospholipase D-like domain-containing protein, partial [Pseudomonadota bacterium]